MDSTLLKGTYSKVKGLLSKKPPVSRARSKPWVYDPSKYESTEFYDKAETEGSPPKRSPLSRTRLLQATENIDRAQARTEYEQLEATVIEYSKKEISPSLIDGLEVRREAVPSLTSVREPMAANEAPEPAAGGEARVPLSSVAPLRKGEGRRLPEPEPVFRSDEEFESAKSRLDLPGISEVWALGKVPLEWYRKKLRETMEVKAEGVFLKDTPKQRQDEGGMAFKLRGVKTQSGVNISSLRDDIYPGVEKVLSAYKAIGATPEITSGFRKPETLKRKVRGKVKRSFHLLGRGVDFNWSRLDTKQRKALKGQFDLLAKRGRTSRGNNIWVFDGFSLIIHSEGYGNHVHLEHDTPETQAELDAYMRKLNRRN